MSNWLKVHKWLFLLWAGRGLTALVATIYLLVFGATAWTEGGLVAILAFNPLSHFVTYVLHFLPGLWMISHARNRLERAKILERNNPPSLSE